jgi:hypothetical protein
MSSIEEFVEYAAKLKGNEKSEAQVFLEHLFQAFGHKSLAEIGGILEDRVKKKEGKGKNFADLVWPGKVLIEMKSRGQRLERHYRQVFDYWCQIVPHRPHWVILCNFDEFWIYDFDIQVDEPLDKVLLVDLPHRLSSFSFLKPTCEEPVFGLNRVDVTKASADLIARVFNSMVARDIPREQAQRFILQSVVSLFSEDLNLLPENFFSRLIDECLNSRNPSTESFEKFGGLFRQMNDPKAATGGRFKGVRYFNGGLFSVVDPVELTKEELTDLFAAAKQKWTQVNPAIFGTIFQHSMGKEAQHAFGAHYTSEADIMKVVSPIIVRPWRERLENAKTRKDLIALWDELRSYRVLDPACGSGNFLYVAFRELKRIETDLIVKMRTNFPSMQQFTQGYLSAKQFYGFDVLPFAVELTKVTLLLAKELGIVEANKAIDANDGIAWLDLDPALPLDNLDDNIKQTDALFVEWPKANAIIGNPPYLGSRYLAKEHGYEYANKVYERFPDVPKMADYCTHWFRLAHNNLEKDGRAGLVGTNTIRQNESREASLDYITNNGGTITEAISTQVWSGDAAVHVSIVNWIKGEFAEKKVLYTQLGNRVDSPWKKEEVDEILSSLESAIDTSTAKDLVTNQTPKVVFQGQNPVNKGFFLSKKEAEEWLKQDPSLRQILFPYMIGRDMLEKSGPARWIIDFGKMDQLSAMKYGKAFERLKEKVMPVVLEKAKKEKIATGKENTRWTRMAQKWWQFRDWQPGTMAAIATVPRYIAVSRVTKRPVLEFVENKIHPDTALVIFPFDDNYSFGILQSGIHAAWFQSRCSSMKREPRYTSETVFDTFPWPQKPSEKSLKAVAEAAAKLRDVRNSAMKNNAWSLSRLYDALDVPGKNALRDAHAELDKVVRRIYGMNENVDVLAFLLKLNLECAEKEKNGEAITGPGLPSSITDKSSYVTEDCVKLL